MIAISTDRETSGMFQEIGKVNTRSIYMFAMLTRRALYDFWKETGGISRPFPCCRGFPGDESDAFISAPRFSAA